jgi:alpha-mannosidase
MALDVHVVLHTHWDREWYHPFERFRQRLVALIDELLDDPPSPGEGFLLDGQAIVLEDYEAVRPDRAGELRALLRDGRLEAGPWYVLADELIPGGEALVRNLLTGRRVLRRFDAPPLPVLYCPDSFGHPAALPSIAAGFGLPLIILWRGYGGNGSRWPAGDAARWAAPDGDEVVLFHLPRDGYEFGSHLPTEAIAALSRWQQMRAELMPRSATGVMLVPSGADHHARQADWRTALAALESVGERDGVHRSSLRRFAEQIVGRSAAHRLPRVRGELRDSYGYTWTLQGTFATRAHEKRLNARAERILQREAEPWSALATFRGASRRPLVDEAWRTLLAAHPHDTLCGCSIDDVATAMEQRLRSAIHQAEGIRDDAILDLIGHDPAAAREARSRWRPNMIVRNPVPRARSGVAIVEIEEFIVDVPVGPGSAGALAPETVVPTRAPVVEALGRLQVLSRELRYSRVESPRHYPDNDLVSVTRVAAWIDDAPPYGIASHAIGGEGTGGGGRRQARDRVIVEKHALRNAALVVTVDDTGAVTLQHLESRRCIAPLIDFVAEADVGDLYTPAPRERPYAVTFRGVRRVHRGPLRGELALRFRIADASTPAPRGHVDVAVHLILDAGAPALRLSIRGENRRTDHRLRLVVRSDAPGDSVWADAAFGPVRREPIVVSEKESAVELPPPTAPLHRYVSRFTESGGVTLISDGLAEYEARDDGSFLVTVVRAVGTLSRSGLPERPGHAGWPVPTPGAQCLGPFAAELAVFPHGPRLRPTIDAIERAADDVLLPLAGTTLRSALGVAEPVSGVELFGAGLAFSTLKESEDGEWLVLRCVNVRDDEVEGRWGVPFEIAETRLARLDETIMSELAFSGREIPFLAAPRGIVTILVR